MINARKKVVGIINKNALITLVANECFYSLEGELRRKTEYLRKQTERNAA